MAFQAPTVGQERANRKILEQLEEQKKRLRLQHNPQNNSGSSNSSGSAAANPMSQNSGAAVIHMAMDSQQMTVAQKTAMQHAMANSTASVVWWLECLPRGQEMQAQARVESYLRL